MPCFYPLKGFRSKTINPDTKKRSIVFNRSQGFVDQEVILPCGQCIGCRLERSRQWAIRCHHEASMHEHNCFITLTYNNKHLPENGTLVLEHFQNFMKRLRKRFPDRKIKFFHCGEYGDKKGRPHYHACLFNFDFPDKQQFRTTEAGFPVYRSKILEKLWTFGYSEIGTVTFESAAYVARYITKKITGKGALEHYNQFDKETGEIYAEKKPEYTTMSRRTGIGHEWYENYKTESIEEDYIIIHRQGQAVQMRIPKYYDNKFEIENPEEFQKLKTKRLKKAKENLDNSDERLQVKEELQQIKAQQLIRSYESNPYAEELQNEWSKDT